MHDRHALVVDDPDVRTGGRTSLMTVRALAAGGYRPLLLTTARGTMAAASNVCAGVVVADEPSTRGVLQAVRRLTEETDDVTTFPTGDGMVLALHPEHGHLVDKSCLAERAREVGFETPPTQMVLDAAQARSLRDRLRYPVVVKPARAHGTRVARDPASFVALSQGPFPILVQPFLPLEIRTMAGVLHDGRFRALVHQRFLRTWPPDAGMAAASVTTPPEPERESKGLALLDGYEGVFQLQFLGPYLMDANLRVYASLSLALAAGVNLPAIFCDARRGVDAPLRRATPGVYYRWLDADLRHAIVGLRDGTLSPIEALRQLRPRRHTARGGPESLRDPKPALARGRQVLSGRSRGPG
ncbi:MAG: hypothetical protein ACM3OO_05475 [Planctomycetaceae bacterium]